MQIADLKTDGFWYLASPYTHSDAFTRHERAKYANDAAGLLLSSGVFVHQPIWAAHRISNNFTLPTDHLFWLNFNKAFIDPSVGMIILTLDGWKESKGCQQEIEYVRSLKKPIWTFDGLACLKELI